MIAIFLFLGFVQQVDDKKTVNIFRLEKHTKANYLFLIVPLSWVHRYYSIVISTIVVPNAIFKNPLQRHCTRLASACITTIYLIIVFYFSISNLFLLLFASTLFFFTPLPSSSSSLWVLFDNATTNVTSDLQRRNNAIISLFDGLQISQPEKQV